MAADNELLKLTADERKQEQESLRSEVREARQKLRQLGKLASVEKTLKEWNTIQAVKNELVSYTWKLYEDNNLTSEQVRNALTIKKYKLGRLLTNDIDDYRIKGYLADGGNIKKLEEVAQAYYYNKAVLMNRKRRTRKKVSSVEKVADKTLKGTA